VGSAGGSHNPLNLWPLSAPAALLPAPNPVPHPFSQPRTEFDRFDPWSSQPALEIGAEFERLSLGPEKTDRNAGGMRMGASGYSSSDYVSDTVEDIHSPQIAESIAVSRGFPLSRSNRPLDPWSIIAPNALLPALSNTVPYQPRTDFNPLVPFGSGPEYTSISGDSRPAVHNMYPSIQYPASNTASEPAHPLFYSHLWPTPTPSSSIPYHVPSQHPFPAPGEPRFGTFCLPTTDVDLSHTQPMNHDDLYPSPPSKAIRYPSAHFEPHSSTRGEPNYLFAGEVREPVPELNVTLTNRPDFPWDHPQDEPRTSIHGSTFISGNVNHIQRQGDLGKHAMLISYSRTC
jgi:hypothetical protein